LENPEQLAPNAIPSIFDYAQNPDKTENNQLIRGYECFPELADEQFATSHELYEINTGRTPKVNSRLLYHMRQSFAPGEIDPQVANRIGYELALEFTGGNHQFVVATHTDKAQVLSFKRCIKHLLFFMRDRSVRNGFSVVLQDLLYLDKYRYISGHMGT